MLSDGNFWVTVIFLENHSFSELSKSLNKVKLHDLSYSKMEKLCIAGKSRK
jgi:hypothetical protein